MPSRARSTRSPSRSTTCRPPRFRSSSAVNGAHRLGFFNGCEPRGDAGDAEQGADGAAHVRARLPSDHRCGDRLRLGRRSARPRRRRPATSAETSVNAIGFCPQRSRPAMRAASSASRPAPAGATRSASSPTWRPRARAEPSLILPTQSRFPTLSFAPKDAMTMADDSSRFGSFRRPQWMLDALWNSGILPPGRQKSRLTWPSIGWSRPVAAWSRGGARSGISAMTATGPSR